MSVNKTGSKALFAIVTGATQEEPLLSVLDPLDPFGTDFELFFGAGQFENCRHVIFLPVLVLACLVDLRHRECSGMGNQRLFQLTFSFQQDLAEVCLKCCFLLQKLV